MKRNKQLKAVLGIGLGLALLYFIWKTLRTAKATAGDIVTNIKTAADTSAINDALHQNGIDDVRTTYVTAAAKDIFDAFYNDSWFGFGEDEAKAANALNSLKSVNEAKACATIYFASYKKHLYDDFQKYLYGFEMSYYGVNTMLLNATKGV